jgi:hypothetical protein
VPQFERKLEEAAQMTRVKVLVRGGRKATGNEQNRRSAYSMRRPLIARAITSCWICSVPSKMS